MSDLAITKTGLMQTASEFHDDFILYKKKYDDFTCPFCSVGLVPKAVYIEGPQGKSPHFSCYPKKPHINGCDGYQIFNGKSAKSSSTRNKIKIGKEEFQFPEKLVSRKKETSKNDDNANICIEIDSVEKVRPRRESTVLGDEKAKYTSSLIRSFAASYKAIISLCYRYAKENKLEDKKRKKLIKKSLTKAPLDLEGYQTNYQAAFKGTKFFCKYSRIWNGTGDVLINEDRIYIRSNQICEYKNEYEVKKLTFYIFIQIPIDLKSRPAYHQTTINRLIRARENKNQVRWFAYGAPELVLDKKSVLLNIHNFDHLFIEKSNNNMQLTLKARG